jgi:phosphohistidine phosphatase SixA
VALYRVWMVRHGEYIGVGADSQRLTPRGVSQMQRAGKGLAQLADRIVVRSSDLLRALNSARIIAVQAEVFDPQIETHSWLASGVYSREGYDLAGRIAEISRVVGADVLLVMHAPDIKKFLEDVCGQGRQRVANGECWQVAGPGGCFRLEI